MVRMKVKTAHMTIIQADAGSIQFDHTRPLQQVAKADTQPEHAVRRKCRQPEGVSPLAGDDTGNHLGQTSPDEPEYQRQGTM